MKKIKIKAFTLIELLVVVVIIGILATFVVIALSGYQTKTREAKRKNDVQQVFTALQSYVTSPPTTPAIAIPIPSSVTLITSGNYADLKGPDNKPYLQAVPLDNGQPYVYFSGNGVDGYAVWATSVAGATLAPADPTTCWFEGTAKSNIQKSSLDATDDACTAKGGPTISGGIM